MSDNGGMIGDNVDKKRGQGKVLRRMGPGAYFGEIAVLAGIPRHCGVRARTLTDVVVLTETAFRPILNAYANMRKKLYAAMYAGKNSAHTAARTRCLQVYIYHVPSF